jgi:peptidoglycan-N-acetylglucosamine deacetylase
VLAFLAVAFSAPVEVHLTIDDAPWQIERGDEMPLAWAEVEEWNQKIIAALGKRSVSASVMYVCERIQEGENTVSMWSKAGHTLGNHTNSHQGLSRKKTEIEAWLADVRVCHDILNKELPKSPTWFRYPYLDYGMGRGKRDRATAGLAQMGYRTMPVTVATSEWVHAYAYRRVRNANDLAGQREVVADWHRHMDEALEEGRKMARHIADREVPQVVLVHVNELVADHLGELIDRWQDKEVTFVDSETAMADEVYSWPNLYDGRGGISWFWRVVPEEKHLPYWFSDEEGRLRERYHPLD